MVTSEPLSALRASVREAEAAVEDGRRRVDELKKTVRRLPTTQTLEQQLSDARRTRTLNYVIVVTGVASLVLAYVQLIEPSSDLDDEAMAAIEAEIEATRARSRDEEVPPEVQDIVDEEVEIAMDGRYPAAMGEARGRSPYPAIDFGREGASEQSLRWANIGLAACQVRNRPLAQHAARVLSNRHAPHTPSGRALDPVEAAMTGQTIVAGEDAANQLRVWLHLQCGPEMGVLDHLLRR